MISVIETAIWGLSSGNPLICGGDVLGMTGFFCFLWAISSTVAELRLGGRRTPLVTGQVRPIFSCPAARAVSRHGKRFSCPVCPAFVSDDVDVIRTSFLRRDSRSVPVSVPSHASFFPIPSPHEGGSLQVLASLWLWPVREGHRAVSRLDLSFLLFSWRGRRIDRSYWVEQDSKVVALSAGTASAGDGAHRTGPNVLCLQL